MAWPSDHMFCSLGGKKWFSEHGMIATDQYTVFLGFRQRFKLKDKAILEVGGSLPSELVNKEGVKTWVSVDPLNEDVLLQGYQKIRGHASSLSFNDDAFDLVFSSNAFEHISNLDASLHEIERVLKPGGGIYAHFGPIWSAPDGSHIEKINHKGVTYNFWDRPLIPPWHHLILSKKELRTMLLSVLDPELVDKVLGFVFNSSWLNRMWFEDYMNLFQNSPLLVKTLEVSSEIDYNYSFPKYELPVVHKEIKQRLRKLTSERKGIRYRDMKIVMQKP